MNPNMAKHGRSFKGAWQYYMHDPEAETRNRIAWASTYGTISKDPDKAWKVMAYTAKSRDRLKQASSQKASGRKDVKPVMAYSLSWRSNHDPEREHMEETAIRSIKALGLEEHEAIIVAHSDRPHKHVHVIINRIHPVTGLTASDSHSWRKLSDFSREYQREYKMDYCPKREENYQKRQQGQNAKYGDPHIQNAWNSSDNAQSFVNALEENGYKIAQGRKRLVVIDPYGKVHNPVRHLEGVKAKVFNDRMKTLDHESLQDANELAKKIQAQRKVGEKPAVSEKRDTSEAKQAFDRSAEKTRKQTFNESSGKAKEPAVPRYHGKPNENPGLSEEEALREGETFNPRNCLQRRYLEDSARLSQQYGKMLRREKNALREFYKLDEHKSDIKDLEEKIRTASWWHRLTGTTRKDRQELGNLKLGYADARMRMDERIGAIQSKFEAERTELKSNYKQSREELENKQDKEPDRTHEMKGGPTRSPELQQRMDSINQRRATQTQERGGPSPSR